MIKGEKFVYLLNGNLYINLTNRCCNDCSFCIRRSGDGIHGDTLWLKREPGADEVIGLIKEIGRNNFNEAVFCGYGESTYKLRELVWVASFLKEQGVVVRLNTNGLGSMINGYDIVPFLKDKIDIVSVSLNESNYDDYDKLCGSVFGKDAFSGLIDFSSKCVQAGIKTYMTIVDVIEESHIKSCEEICNKIGAELKVRKYIADNVRYE